MKQKITFVMALLMLGLSSRAAQFDELDLQGLWELTSCEGEYAPFTACSEFYEEELACSDYKYLYIGYIVEGMTLPGMPGPIEDGWPSAGILYNPGDDGALIAETSVLFQDFIITNENKLHMLSPDHFALHFVLETLNNQEMRFSSYDGKCHVVYKRVNDVQSVKTVAEQTSASKESRYGIDGIPVSSKDRGIHIVRKGSKVSKELVKK